MFVQFIGSNLKPYENLGVVGIIFYFFSSFLIGFLDNLLIIKFDKLTGLKFKKFCFSRFFYFFRKKLDEENMK
jgi:hypothetical protein